MLETERKLNFRSVLSPLLEKFLQEKRACGYRYSRGSLFLQSLDRFLADQNLAEVELSREAVERWTAKKAHEKKTNQATRVSYARQFAQFLIRQGVKAFVPVPRLIGICTNSFVPCIFTRFQVRSILAASDRIARDKHSPLRHMIVPLIFRLLYACGLRAGEALKLTVRDVDLSRGVLTIREAKFRKNRLVPIPPSLRKRLREYSAKMGERTPGSFFFPAPDGGRFHVGCLYHAFRQLLSAAGIPHGGRGRGPRLHDLRHTFAVHRLLRWYQEGADLNNKLPVLATFMGHLGLDGTQRYLHLIPEILPEVTARQEAAFGEVIPSENER